MRRYGAAFLLVVGVVLISLVPTAPTAPTSPVGLTLPLLLENHHRCARLRSSPPASGRFAPDWDRAGPIQGGLELSPRAVISIGGGAFVWGDLPEGRRTDFKRIDLNSGVVSEVTEPPSDDCAHVIAAGTRLLSWSLCEPGSIYQFDGDQTWAPIAESGGSTLDTDVVWTGFDLWFWRLGLRIALPSGATTKVEPAPFEGPVEVALSGHLMVLPGEGKPPLVSTGGTWDEVRRRPDWAQRADPRRPPGGNRHGQRSLGICTLEREHLDPYGKHPSPPGRSAPRVHPDDRTDHRPRNGWWRAVGSNRVATAASTPTSDTGSAVRMVPGSRSAITCSRLSPRLISRPLPTGASGLIESQAIPLQAMALAIPEGWEASLVDGGTDLQYVYTLSDGDTSCQVAALRGEGGRSLEEKVVVQSAWNGLPMLVSVDTFSDGWMAEVDYATETSDLVQVSCATRALALGSPLRCIARPNSSAS